MKPTPTDYEKIGRLIASLPPSAQITVRDGLAEIAVADCKHCGNEIYPGGFCDDEKTQECEFNDDEDFDITVVVQWQPIIEALEEFYRILETTS